MIATRAAKPETGLEQFQESDLAYLSSLYEQYRGAREEERLSIGDNFLPSALLGREERERLLGWVEYADLLGEREAHEDAARRTELTLYPMNGGIGTSLRREKYLKRIWKSLGREFPVRLGAKGTDLFFDAGPRKVSISEAKILRLLSSPPRYARVALQHLVSTETLQALRELLDKPGPGRSKSYRWLLNERADCECREPALQAALPTVNSSGELTLDRMAPGGHGQWGVYLLIQALRDPAITGGRPRVSAIYNEDGINNGPDPVLVGWMSGQRIPAVMVTTTKTALDRKGGLVGLVRNGGGPARKGILERAQAEAAGQLVQFEEMGLSAGESGTQFFNTNTALLNDALLGPFLKDLVHVIGMERLVGIIGPALIANKKIDLCGGLAREFVQLEGALCSVLMNLDGYLSTTREPAVRALLDRWGFADAAGAVRFLRIVNVDRERRIDFFTPVKTALDFWLQFHSGLFRVDAERWTLAARRNGPLPSLKLSSDYDDLADLLDAFEGADVAGLKSLEVAGSVHLERAVLKGNVRIRSESPAPVSLQALKGQPPGIVIRSGRIFLEDVSIALDRRGVASVEPHRPGRTPARSSR